jgi:hypothetical protein
VALMRAGDGRAALAELERARALLPRDADLLADLGRVQQALGQQAEARRTLQQATRLAPAGPRGARPFLVAGNVLRRQRRCAEARAAYGEYLKRRPQAKNRGRVEGWMRACR